MGGWLTRGRWAVGALTLLWAVARWAGHDPAPELDRGLFDRALVAVGQGAPAADPVVVVEFDELSLAELGETWPIRRLTWAALIERVASLEPAAVMVDSVFAEPTHRTLEEALQEALSASGAGEGPAQEGALRAQIQAILEAQDPDRRLSEALADAGGVLLGAVFHRKHRSGGARDWDGAIQALDLDAAQVQGLGSLAAEAVVSIPELALSAEDNASLNVLVDSDGVVRRYPYAIAVEGSAFPSMALATWLAVGGSRARLDEVLAADHGAPLLSYATLQRRPRVSASDLLMTADLSAVREVVRGRVVLIGITAAAHADQFTTPVDWEVPGLFLHAEAFENLRAHRWIASEGPAAAWGIVLVLLTLGSFVLWSARTPSNAGIGRLIGGGLASGALGLGLLLGALSWGGLWLGAAPALAGLAALVGVEVGLRMWHLQVDRRLLEARQLADAARIEQQRHIQLLIESVGDAILSVDPDALIHSANPAAERLLGRPATQLVGTPLDEIFSDQVDLYHELETKLQGIERGGARPIESTLRQPNRDPIEVEMTASRMESDGASILALVIRDVTERKETERMKEEFISTVSHELRTPLTSIRGSLGLVTGGVVGEIPERAGGLLKVAQANCDRLVRMVGDMLDLSKMRAGMLDLDLASLDLEARLDEIVAANLGYGTEHGVRLVRDRGRAPIWIDGDSDRLEQAVTNLLSNAIKYSPEGERVIVRATAGEGEVRVEVQDFGPGVPVEFRERIFEPFTQAKGSKPGTGLGMGITKGIVEMHRGTIGLQSELGVGTTFFFVLPLAELSAVASEGAAAAEA